MMDVQVWIDLFKEHWVVFVVALIALLLVINLVRTVIKWVLVLGIAAFIVIYSGISIKDISQAVTTATNDTMSTMKNEAINVMKNEAKDAKMQKNADGSFVIKTPNLEVSGQPGSDKVKVVFRGVSLGEWSRGEALDSFLLEAQKNTR